MRKEKEKKASCIAVLAHTDTRGLAESQCVPAAMHQVCVCVFNIPHDKGWVGLNSAHLPKSRPQHGIGSVARVVAKLASSCSEGKERAKTTNQMRLCSYAAAVTSGHVCVCAPLGQSQTVARHHRENENGSVKHRNARLLAWSATLARA
jgi:hypothetical protein